MNPADLLTIRESLGLPREWLAAHLDITVAQLEAYETGAGGTIPSRVVAEVTGLDNFADETAFTTTRRLEYRHVDEQVFVVPLRDEDSPDGFPASYWRAIAARVRWGLPGLWVAYADTRQHSAAG